MNDDNLYLTSYCHKIFFGLSILLLSACSGQGMDDLEEYVAKTKARKNPHVDPIPDFGHVPSYFYEVQHMRDPFEPLISGEKGPMLQAFEEGKKKKECPNPGSTHRVRIGLELMPLDALQMVGTVETKDQSGRTILWALIVSKSDGTIYRVKQGDYMGNNYGQVINVFEEGVEVLEQIPDGEGCWQENIAKISLL